MMVTFLYIESFYCDEQLCFWSRLVTTQETRRESAEQFVWIVADAIVKGRWLLSQKLYMTIIYN